MFTTSYDVQVINFAAFEQALLTQQVQDDLFDAFFDVPASKPAKSNKAVEQRNKRWADELAEYRADAELRRYLQAIS